MPWIPDDDPVLKELRAWRDELGTKDGSRAVGDVKESSPNDSVPTAVSAAQEANTASVPVDLSRATEQGRRREQARTPAETPGDSGRGLPRRSTDELSWLPFGRLRLPETAPQPVIDIPAPRPVTTGAPRHSTWDVMSSQRAPQPQPIKSEAERKLADASTVAFPMVTPEDLADEGPVETAIEAVGLHKRFGEFVAVQDVSFAVPKGKIVALLGPNGAGKTTTVNMLCTLLKPDGGSATVAGCDVVEDAPGVRRAIMLTGQFAALDEALTGRENLILFGRLLGMTKKSAAIRADELLEEFGLTAAAGRRVGQYSGGMRRRIDIACGLVTKPEVVFLDEPTTGLDPRSRQDVWAVVEQLRSSGVTILLTTQYLEEADVLSDNIIVIDKGRVIAEGTSDELKAETGAAYCDITPSHPAYLPRLRARLRDMIGDFEQENEDALTVSVPAPDGPQTLAEVIRRTEAAKIPLADIALRRPSLDEVFLALTGDNGKADDPE
ncbi:MAG: ATP-binding cassette domain-containing protein [Rhodococcus sp.]|nr:ATP-binding cassette domain-containing protein [Rhodococcus sp. (in: high G+C Gram-positive bacteria)]